MLIKATRDILRDRLVDELEGRAFYYVGDDAALLENKNPFGFKIIDSFPSAIYDIDEASKCLALRRSTASVMHLMRTLEAGLAALAGALQITVKAENWNTLLNDIEREIRSRTKATHGQEWKENDEPFFTEAATHFRLIKNAWRNHAQHARSKYTDEEAREIYSSVRSFMKHLSKRLSEPGAAS